MFLMSDIRTKLLLGTTISAVTIMFVMASGVNIFANDTSASEKGFAINGHVTVLAVHPDGSTSYSQTDNVILGSGKTLAATQLFDASAGGASLAEAFNCVALGKDATVDTTTSALTDPMIATVPQCDTDGIANPVQGITGGVGEEITIIPPDFTILAADAGTITEVILGQAIAGFQLTGVLSHVDITDVTVATNTLLTITYTVTVD